MCVSGYAFSPLTTYGGETWHGGRGKGLIISEGHQRSKFGSNFTLLRLSSNLGRVMLDRDRVQSAYRGGRPPKSSEVKGQVKFQVARIELKLGEGDARSRASAKSVSRRICPPRSSEVKGQVKGRVKFQVAPTEVKLGEGDAGPRVSAKCLSRRMPSEVK